MKLPAHWRLTRYCLYSWSKSYEWIVYIVVQTIVGGDKMKRHLMLIVILLFDFSLLLIGCIQGEQVVEDVDATEDAEAGDQMTDTISEDGEDEDSDKEDEVDQDENVEIDVEEDADETVARQLYLVDVNGAIAPQTLELPSADSKEVASQVLQYLIKDCPVTSILPNGFQAVLPEETEVLGLNLQEDGTLIVDVSKEFENYEAEDELKVLQSMTFTLTQFEEIDKIELWINGYPQDEMPVNGTPMTEGYSRTNGINIIATDTLDLLNSQAVTMYYPTEYNENRYYVPITQHIEVDELDRYSPIVQALIDGPGYELNVTDVFNAETLLMDRPRLNDGVLELEFNDGILKDSEEGIISDEVMETLARTLTEDSKVEAIEVRVKDKPEILNENGEVYDEPVTAQIFTQVKKM